MLYIGEVVSITGTTQIDVYQLKYDSKYFLVRKHDDAPDGEYWVFKDPTGELFITGKGSYIDVCNEIRKSFE